MQFSATDTHIHCWDPQRVHYSWLENVPALNHAFLLEDLEEVRLGQNVSSGVLVQAANSLEDTDWMLETATNHSWIHGVVGWLPLTDPSATNDLLQNRYAENTLLKGIRHLIHDEADPRWILQEKVLEGLGIISKYGLVYDFVGIKAVHLETALELVSRLPHLRMVLDHLNQPPAEPRAFSQWKTLLGEISANKNVYVKISGLGTAMGKGENWGAKDITPSIAFVLEQFGENRCFCGGDWPVSLLAGSYDKTWSIYREVLEKLLDAEGQEKVLRKNAEEFYKL